MNVTDLKNLFMFCGGLGMFLYGMHTMSDGIQKSAGNKMRQLLEMLTNNRLMAVLMGALITAIIQSSGATTVMVVGFVNAGLMTLTQAVGVIMGANIGTCITSWIVSLGQLGDSMMLFSPSLYAPLLLGIGAIMIMFIKKPSSKLAGEILVGLGLLFIGLDFMKDAAGSYTDLPIFKNAFEMFGSNPVLGILIGAAVTAIMQSSSASVGILQMLAASGGVVTAASAVYISLGSNIGSCCTAMLSSLGAPRNAKRAAVIHLSFNVIGAVLFGAGMFLFFQFRPALGSGSIDSVGISIFHTVFNIVCTALLFPFAKALVALSGKVVPAGKKDKELAQENAVEEVVRHLDKRFLETPGVAVENVLNEVVHMGEITLENATLAVRSVFDEMPDEYSKVYENEKTINSLEKLLTEYLVQINNLSLTEKQHQIINHLFYIVSDIERVGDHTENIAEMAEYLHNNNIVFSETGISDLKEISEKVLASFQYAIDARKTGSKESVRHVVKLEDMVDDLEEELREKHIARLSNNECSASSGVIFLDIISNLERISDHADNIAGYVKDEM
ncbi:Na/Pi cotransporter family protein [Cuneatibacter caecimuris]|uniref:Phosphate:Na+ symporter n=1 Tax=Cuneatibacter caecimuris TaxID=1796618 RepID=A0A4Q7PM49_9FIRM|nr:Na/Pi cotransporter family protein [Cuneatibacter caecimuris]RZT00970.1 phosphate:Na+ symporter [Cuneatibacter caecimuris]